ncbi:MAG: hypothetical protein EBE86_004095 [Hormoscilla sp. GUM202]|nr:hypothetical protein [Hormoscilla sp. GUM202]
MSSTVTQLVYGLARSSPVRAGRVSEIALILRRHQPTASGKVDQTWPWGSKAQVHQV